MNPRICFATTCKGRAQHIKNTLPRNISDNAGYDNCCFVVLDYSSQDDLQEYIKRNHQADLASGKLVFYSFPLAGRFCMSHAKNMAHRAAMLEGAEILVNQDADGYTGERFAQYISEQFKQKEVFLQAPWNRWVGGEWICQDHDDSWQAPVDKGANGRMVYTTHAFLKAGGYDEKFQDWGAEDRDFNIRLRRLGYEPSIMPKRFTETILHTNKMRFREYPHAMAKHGDCWKIKVEDSNESLANFGRIGCGVVYRNFSDLAINLAPLPTRIFGIGAHKTTTTSLHMALDILGFDSAHWESAHWAKAIWREMNATGHSATLERSYALCDIPIPMLYRKLDLAYPGSKFILTTTSEEAWIQAAERHWDPNYNRWRGQWDNDCFTHIAHRRIYGRTDFDRATFLQRYRRHNLDVLSYFAGRPDDLLVMPMSEGAGWKELCGFLGKPIPSVPYPHGNPDMNRHWLHSGDL